MRGVAIRNAAGQLARFDNTGPLAEIATAKRARYHRRMSRQSISTERAPRAIGPYCQAVAVSAGRVLYCSGQIPLDPGSGELIGAGDVRAQTERVLENLGAVLVAGGASFSSVVKTTIYLVDLADFAAVNEIYARYFAENPPARATIQAAGLPRGALVEIEAIATVGS